MTKTAKCGPESWDLVQILSLPVTPFGRSVDVTRQAAVAVLLFNSMLICGEGMMDRANSSKPMAAY